MAESSEVTVGERVQGVVDWGFKDADQVVDTGENEVGFGRNWKVQVFGREPAQSVTDAGGVSIPDPNGVTAVVSGGGTNIPGILAMGGPSAALVRFLVGDHMNARGSERGSIVIKAAMEEFMGRELGIEAGTAEKIEGGFRLWQESIPQEKGKIGVCGTEACDEVVFEGADGTFGSVATVHARGDQLVVCLFLGHEGLEQGGAFIIEGVEFGPTATED